MYLLSEYEGNTEKLWQRTFSETSCLSWSAKGLSSKLSRMPEDARMKLRQTIGRIISDGAAAV